MHNLLSEIVTILWRSSWQLLLLSILIWPLSQLSRHAYPKFAYGLWGILLFKSLIPLKFSLSGSATTILQTPSAFITTLPPILGSNAPTSLFNPILATAVFWAMGVIILTLRFSINEIRFRKKLQNARVWPDQEKLRALIKAGPLRREPILFTSEVATTPFTLGILHPRIFLPSDAVEWSEIQLRSILAHEIAHINRFDLVVIYLQMLAKILYFFHPVVWLMNDQLNFQRERICDDEAIRGIKADPGQYGRILLNQLEQSIKTEHQPVLAGGFFISHHRLVQRFEYIVNRTSQKKERLKMHHRLLFTMVLIIGILINCQYSKSGVGTSEPDAAKSEFVEYDTPPEPVGGSAEIQKNMIYPELAREAGIEGIVIVQTKIDIDGNASQSKIIKGIEDGEINEAAINAIEKTKWNPALNNNQPVAVWVTIPVHFKLATDKPAAP